VDLDVALAPDWHVPLQLRPLVAMEARWNTPLRISSISVLSHSRTTQSKKRRQSAQEDLA
jgi:hypothetical protein